MRPVAAERRSPACSATVSHGSLRPGASPAIAARPPGPPRSLPYHLDFSTRATDFLAGLSIPPSPLFPSLGRLPLAHLDSPARVARKSAGPSLFPGRFSPEGGGWPPSRRRRRWRPSRGGGGDSDGCGGGGRGGGAAGTGEEEEEEEVEEEEEEENGDARGGGQLFSTPQTGWWG